jgi:hypothetical protein
VHVGATATVYCAASCKHSARGLRRGRTGDLYRNNSARIREAAPVTDLAIPTWLTLRSHFDRVRADEFCRDYQSRQNMPEREWPWRFVHGAGGLNARTHESLIEVMWLIHTLE